MAVAASAKHEHWSSRAAFIFAAVGSAVGLGNIWKFPYETAQSGGGAFVLIYILFVFAIGVPVMIAELALGRRGQASPPSTMRKIANQEGKQSLWSSVGWLGVLGAFLVLSFYSVVAGWTLSYLLKSVSGALIDISSDRSNSVFTELTQSPGTMIFWHAVFMSFTVLVVARGIQNGLEKAVKWLMPMLFFLLLLMVGYSLSTGAAGEAFRFLFTPDFSKLTPDVVLRALGQAFFSLSLALGTIMAYGSYLSRDVSIPRSALVIASADTAIALLAGLAIFPIVFAYGLTPTQEEGLVFITLPIAFGQMTGGLIVGSLFFFLLSIAALTSSISLLEPVVEWIHEDLKIKRGLAAALAGGACFLVGLGTVFSFNRWAEIKFLAGTVLNNLIYLTNNLTMPLGGLLMIVFVGWFVSRASMRNELHTISDRQFDIWRAMARYVCPLALLAIFYSVLS